jgi:hypothetical protein
MEDEAPAARVKKDFSKLELDDIISQLDKEKQEYIKKEVEASWQEEHDLLFKRMELQFQEDVECALRSRYFPDFPD